MTHHEAEVILRRVGVDRPLEWELLPDKGFVRLKGQPCPFLQTDGRCEVYDLRPTVCRTFICGRVPGEAFEATGPHGCQNLTDRLDQSTRFTHHVATLYRHVAREWAIPHGWPKARVSL